VPFFLFAADSAGQNAPDDLVPVERSAGVPEYYLLHVANFGELWAKDYEIRFDGRVGAIPYVEQGDRADLSFTPVQVGGQPVAIPIGDFNGDGSDDYIFAVEDSVAAGVPTVAHITLGGGHNGYHSGIEVPNPSLDPTIDPPETREKWVIIDLGEEKTFDAVQLHPARPWDWQPDTPGYLFPVRFQIDVSDTGDFENDEYTTVVDHTAEDVPNPGSEAPTYSFDPVPAQYVRLLVTELADRGGGMFAFALAQMQVLLGDQNLVLGATVEALDQMESPAWSPQRLVNGILESTPPAFTARAYNGYHSAFADSAEEEKWVAIDLGAERDFEAVELQPARAWSRPGSPEYLLPVRFRIDVSDSETFDTFTTVVDCTGEDVADQGTSALRYDFDSVNGRYVRLVVTKLADRGDGMFAFALARMRVLAGGRNLALDAPVTYLDEVGWRTWSPGDLVDRDLEPTPPSPDLLLRLPAPVMAVGGTGLRTVFSTPGDYNGDGFDDIAVAVTRVDASLPPDPNEGVYILFGRDPSDVEVLDVEVATALGFGNFDDGIGDFVSLPNDLVRSSPSLTIEAWFKVEPDNGGVIFGYQNKALAAGLPTESVPLLYVGTDGLLRGSFWQHAGGASIVTSGNTVDDGQWHHVALVLSQSKWSINVWFATYYHSASQQDLYVDGELVDSEYMYYGSWRPISYRISHLNMRYNQIGSGFAGGWGAAPAGEYPFDGDIREVRLWQRARAAGEIQQQMDAQLTGNESGLVGYWQFINVSDSTMALDSSRRGNHGELGGGVADRMPERILTTTVLQPRQTQLSLLGDAGVTIKGFSGPIALANAGQIVVPGDPDSVVVDSLVVGDAEKTYYLPGRTDWTGAGTQLVEDFEGDFTWGSGALKFTRDAGSLWNNGFGRGFEAGHSPVRSLHYGNQEDYAVTPPNQNSAYATLRLADIGYKAGSEVELSFRYYLETEPVESADTARVYVKIVGGTTSRQIASNQVNEVLAAPQVVAPLRDPTGGWVDFRYPLGALLTGLGADPSKSLEIRWSFDPNDVNNDLPGWYIDDVKLTRVPTPRDIADEEYAHASVLVGPPSVAGIGDFNDDGFDDFARLALDAAPNSEVALHLCGSNGATDQTITLTSSSSLAGYRLVAAGDVDADGWDDLLVTGRDRTYLVYGRDGTANIALEADAGVVRFDAGNMMPIDDVDGDGRPDLAAIELADTPRVDADPVGASEEDFLTHARLRIYLGDAIPWEFAAADLVVEPGDPIFQALEVSEVPPAALGSLGDLDLDGRDDFVAALADSLDVFYGRASLPLDPPLPPAVPGGDVLPPEAYKFTLATPSAAPGAGAAAGLDLTNEPGNTDLANALALAGEGLAGAAAVGDVNGDGLDDFLVTGAEAAYLLFGPVALEGARPIDAAAVVVVDTTSLGLPVATVGNVNGDRFDDLLFVRDDGDASTVSIVFGGPDLPRVLEADWVGEFPDIGRTGTSRQFGQGATAVLLNWNGDGCDDLALVSPTGGAVYSGQALRDGDWIQIAAIQPDESDRISAARRLGLDPMQIDPDAKASWTLTAGDVTGDGLDDLLLVDARFLAFREASGLPDVGRAYLLLGRTRGVDLDLGFDAAMALQSFFLGGQARVLGDLNGDGYD